MKIVRVSRGKRSVTGIKNQTSPLAVQYSYRVNLQIGVWPTSQLLLSGNRV